MGIFEDTLLRELIVFFSAELAKQWFKNGEVWNKGPYHETDLLSG